MQENPYADLPENLRDGLQSARYEDLSGRKRCAKWLIEEVGVGGIFTYNELRERFDDTQIDRRCRDLKVWGWVISTNKQDSLLALDAHRLDKIGGLRGEASVSARLRRLVFDEADNRCAVCGLAAGERNPDTGETTTLQLGHWIPRDQGGDPTSPSNLRAECERCNHAIQNLTGAVVTAEGVRVGVGALSRGDRQQLLQWMLLNHRRPKKVEKLYYEWRQLPSVSRQEIVDLLKSQT